MNSLSADLKEKFQDFLEYCDEHDPFVWFLRRILKGFLTAKLKNFEEAFVKDNIQKHRKVLWINVAAAVLVLFGLRETPPDSIGTVITVLLAPVMVLGGAWFAISFGGVPQKLMDIAMDTTFWMFTAFTISLTAMFMAAAFVTSPFLWPVLVLVYVAALIACIQYDTADGLKAGLDAAVLKQSRAAVAFYAKQGVDVDNLDEEEEEKKPGEDVPADQTVQVKDVIKVD